MRKDGSMQYLKLSCQDIFILNWIFILLKKNVFRKKLKHTKKGSTILVFFILFFYITYFEEKAILIFAPYKTS